MLFRSLSGPWSLVPVPRVCVCVCACVCVLPGCRPGLAPPEAAVAFLGGSGGPPRSMWLWGVPGVAPVLFVCVDAALCCLSLVCVSCVSPVCLVCKCVAAAGNPPAETLATREEHCTCARQPWSQQSFHGCGWFFFSSRKYFCTQRCG